MKTKSPVGKAGLLQSQRGFANNGCYTLYFKKIINNTINKDTIKQYLSYLII